MRERGIAVSAISCILSPMKLLALLLLPFTAFAQPGTAVLTWVDGAVLANQTGHKVYSGTSPTTLTQTSAVGNVLATTLTGLSAGMWYFAVTSYSPLVETAFSNLAVKLIAGAPPNPPTIPQPVTSAGPVCTLQVTDNALLCPQVGTVVAGVGCDPTQQVAFLGKTYMLVPKASVVPLAGMQVIAAWSDTCH